MVSAEPTQSLVPYQPFVDGLRAVAVVAVVAYHAGIPGISGGFIGVDIFFVISGYLIISQISSGIGRCSFSFKRFWARRALRILPSYFLVILASCAIAPFVLVMPTEIEEFGWQVLWSSLMVVNHYFLEQQGYFDTSAELKPLLHMWSLAVEEQFYVLAPILLAGLAVVSRRFGAITSLLLMALLFLASLALCIWLTTAVEDKNYAFFVMPLRAWEFIAGGSVGLLVPFVRRAPRWFSEILAAAGITALLISAVLIDSSMAFPSFIAAIPVLATTIIIAAGVAYPTLAVAGALAVKPMVAIGLVSYAWYLWHWPIMSFARIYNFESLPLSWGVGAALLSFVLAVATFLLVERPIRHWRQQSDIDSSWKPLGGGIAAVALVAATGAALAMPVAAATRASLPEWTVFDGDYPDGPCALNNAESAEPCLEEAGGRPIILLMGDSHSRALWRATERLADANGYQLATIMGSGCVGMFDTKKFNRNEKHIRANCVTEFANGENLLPQLQPTHAIIATRWLSYAEGVAARGRQTLAASGSDIPAEDQRRFFIESLISTFEVLESSGIESITVLAPTPEISPSPPFCVYRSDRYAYDRDDRCSTSAERVAELRQEAMLRLGAAVSESEIARLADPMPLLCDQDICAPYISDDGPALYRDPSHFNELGAEIVMNRLGAYPWKASSIE